MPRPSPLAMAAYDGNLVDGEPRIEGARGWSVRRQLIVLMACMAAPWLLIAFAAGYIG